MAVDRNGQSFQGSEGKRIRVHAADGTYEGTVLGTYQVSDDKGRAIAGDVLPHVERLDGTRTQPAAGECELLDDSVR